MKLKNDSPWVRVIFIASALCFIAGAIYYFIRTYNLMQ